MVLWLPFILTTLLHPLVVMSLVPRTPCPEYFYYALQGQRIRGFVSAPPPGQFTEILVRLQLLVKARVPNVEQYPGVLRLSDDPDEVLNRLQRSNFEHIKFIVDFPIQNPLPILLSLSVNGRDICYYNPGTVYGPYTLLDLYYTLKLSATYFPPGGPSLPGPISPWWLSVPPPRAVTTPMPQPFYSSTQSPIIIVSSRLHEQRPDQGLTRKECGSVIKSNSDTEWPWLVAIYYALTNKLRCPGTLVSGKHVITSGSCLETMESATPENVMVFLGKFDLKEVDRQEVEKIVRGPSSKAGLGFIDVAVLIFKFTVPFSDYVKPICLYSAQNTFKKPYLIGWGKTQSDQENLQVLPKKVSLTVYNNAGSCSQVAGIQRFHQQDMICAEVKSNVGVCENDLGAGMYRKTIVNDRWFLHGVLSNFSRRNGDDCSFNGAAVLFSSVFGPSANYWLQQDLGIEII